MNSKAKGSAGERELCAFLTARGYPAHRNNQRFVGGKGNPDIDAQGLEGYHFEVKRVERLNVSEAMKQAIGDAYGRIPTVVHRRSREPWLITMRLDDFLGPPEVFRPSGGRIQKIPIFADRCDDSATT